MTDEKDINTHVVLVMGIVKKGNKFLIAKRSSNDPQAGGVWAPIGGKIDPGLEVNILQETLKREVKEETGVEIKDDIHLVANDAFTRVSGHHVVALTFLCFWKSGEARPLEDQEEVGWFTLDELLSGDILPSYNKRRIGGLAEYLKKHKGE